MQATAAAIAFSILAVASMAGARAFLFSMDAVVSAPHATSVSVSD